MVAGSQARHGALSPAAAPAAPAGSRGRAFFIYIMCKSSPSVT
jgi:hypothetical protein